MRNAVLGALALVLLVGLAACDPGATVTWVNETKVEVDIYLGDSLHDFSTSIPAIPPRRSTPSKRRGKT